MKSIAILGAGIAGLSSAFALTRRGYKVRLIERGGVGRESTWAGGGILSPLMPWDYPESTYTLSLAAMRAYPAWIENIEYLSQLKTEYWRCGMRVCDFVPEKNVLSWCKKHGLTARYEPAESDSLWLPDIAQVRNPLLAAALFKAVLSQGGKFNGHCTSVNSLVEGRNLEAITCNDGVFQADHFIVCCGAWSGLDSQGIPGVPNIRPIRGQMLLFKLDPKMLETILYRQGLYIIPRLDGHILVGSTLEDAGFDKSTDLATAQRLHAEAARLFPILAQHRPIQHWAGLRPGSPDNIPVIGRHPDFDNVFVNVGHYRYGVTMAPAAAELLADLMEGKTSALDPTPYSWAAAQQRQWGDQL